VKDAQRSLFSVWHEIFIKPAAVNERKTFASGDVVSSNRFNNVLSVLNSCGESERVLSGVFENYLNVAFKDTELKSVVRGTDWFTHFDILHQEILHSQNYSIMGYLHFPLVASHFLFASKSKTKLSFPKQMNDLRLTLGQSNNVLDSVLAEMSPMTRVYCSRYTLVRDVLPSLLYVIQPVFRPVNTQLYSAKEKAELKNLVRIHIAYNITYNQQRNQEGQYIYKMDPDVESVATFTGVKKSGQLTYASKQLISHEIELEKMRRIDMMNVNRERDNPITAAAASISTTSNTPRPDKKSEPPVDGSRTPGNKTTSSHLAKLTPKQIVIKERKATDFFGRVIEMKEKPCSGKEDHVTSDVWFRFKEGYSNAVRRNVKMSSFL